MKKLFRLENLTWAFVRPQQPNDRQLGYAESVWIVTYIEQKYGHKAILTLLDEERLGHDLDQAFTTAIREDTAKFFDEFQDWAAVQVAGWGYDDKTNAEYEQLVADADAMIKAEDYTDAAGKWEQIVKLRPMDLLPHERLMGIVCAVEGLAEGDRAAGADPAGGIEGQSVHEGAGAAVCTGGES
jgi:hypothetical protein